MIGIVTILIITLLSYLFCKLAYKISMNFLEINDFRKYNSIRRKLFIYKFRITSYVAEKTFRYTENFFYNGFIRIFLTSSLDVNLNIFLQLNSPYFSGGDVILLISTYSAILILMIEILIIYKMYTIMDQLNDFFMLQNLKQYFTIIQGVNIDNDRNLNLIILIKKILFMFSLVMLYK